jgi:hypothetical protein
MTFMNYVRLRNCVDHAPEHLLWGLNYAAGLISPKIPFPEYSQGFLGQGDFGWKASLYAFGLFFRHN